MQRFWFLLLSFIISNVVFAQTPESKEYLDVSISVFDLNLPADKKIQNKLDIYPAVRKAEGRYIPVYLQHKLIESDLWGAVRLLPDADIGAELLIEGKIITSDGTRLVLKIIAIDSTGRTWIDKTYSGMAVYSVSLKQPILGTDPFIYLYNEISQDLAEIYAQFSTAEVNAIKAISRLRYSAFLSPDTFTPYLQKNEDGHFVINRLPASNDPNFQRIQEIRAHEYVFIDVVNEQYNAFFANIKPVYDLWRKYRREQKEGAAYMVARDAENRNKFHRGSYRSLRESYDKYRWAKMKEQYLEEISERFNNEILSTDIELEDSLFHLTGALEEQYNQWRSILKELYELEY